jgi:hypothetical protein
MLRLSVTVGLLEKSQALLMDRDETLGFGKGLQFLGSQRMPLVLQQRELFLKLAQPGQVFKNRSLLS